MLFKVPEDSSNQLGSQATAGQTHPPSKAKNNCKPSTSAKLSSRADEETEKLRQRVSGLARISMRGYFHEPSETHIFHCPVVGNVGVRGCGASAVEASQMFSGLLEKEVNGADVDLLLEWQSYLKILQDVAQSEEDWLRIKENARFTGQIGMHTLPDLNDELNNIASSKNLPRSKFSNQLLQKVMGHCWKDLNSYGPDAVRKELSKAQPPQTGKQKESWTLRIDPELHTRLSFFSHALDLSIPNVCALLLWSALQSEAQPVAATAAAPDRSLEKA